MRVRWAIRIVIAFSLRGLMMNLVKWLNGKPSLEREINMAGDETLEFLGEPSHSARGLDVQEFNRRMISMLVQQNEKTKSEVRYLKKQVAKLKHIINL